MRRILAGLACAALIGSAQAQVVTGAMFLPSPVGVILSIGQWIIFESERTYYIEVLGEGRTSEEAKLNGFRIAVEQAVGSVIASETQVNNNRITRDEIISYASGYVTKYEIVKQEPGGIGVKATMKVWIKKSGIANRLLNQSKGAGDFEGAQASVQLSTLQYERGQGDRLVNLVVNDFYRLGFDLSIKPVTVKFDDDRSAVAFVPFTLKWNQDYVKSLWEAVKTTSQEQWPGVCWQLAVGGNCRQPASIIQLSTKLPFGAGGDKVGFGDTVKVNSMLNMMVNTQPRIKATLYTNTNAVMFVGCYTWDMLDHSAGFNVQGAEYFVDSNFYGPKNVVIYKDAKLEGHISFRMNAEQLKNAGRVDMKLVPQNQCPK